MLGRTPSGKQGRTSDIDVTSLGRRCVRVQKQPAVISHGAPTQTGVLPWVVSGGMSQVSPVAQVPGQPKA